MVREAYPPPERESKRRSDSIAPGHAVPPFSASFTPEYGRSPVVLRYDFLAALWRRCLYLGQAN